MTTRIAVENEYLAYEDEGEWIDFEELDAFLTAASRLLAGGYPKEYSLTLERAGIAADFYAYTEDGKPVSRTERREKDCVLALRLLMRSKRKKQFLDGVYTLLLHRKEIEALVAGLRAELSEKGVQRIPGRGKYRFAGVSPLGYTGCAYLYYDEKGEVNAGDYAWVRMGRHDTLQIVYVDSVRYFDVADAPYNPKTVKRILRKAAAEEINNERE